MSAHDPSTEPTPGEPGPIDAAHPRPDRAAPDRPGGGHGAAEDGTQAGLTGGDVDQPDAEADGPA